jgi:hypothetical protein
MDASSAIIEFHAEKSARFSEWVSVCLKILLCTLLAIGLAIVFSLILYALALPDWQCAGIGLACAFCFLVWSVKGATSRLRFCVVLHPEHLQVGAGYLQLNMPYEEVEMYGYAEKAKDDCLSVLWHGRRSIILLPARSLPSCFNFLGERCVNAVFLDRMGREHLPRNPTRPDLSLDTLYRHYRRLAYASLAALAVSLFITILSIVGLVLHLLGKVPQENVLGLTRLLCNGSVAAIVFLLAYWRYTKRANYVSKRLADLNNESHETR